MRSSRLTTATLLLAGFVLAAPVQAARIDFAGVVPVGDFVIPVTPYTESNYTLTGVGGRTDGIFDPGAPFGLVHNGSALFGFCGAGCGGVSITLTYDLGDPFELLSFEASNLLTGFSTAGEQLVVTGNLVGGGTVVQSFTLVQDVMTVFNLGPGFTNLASVTFESSLPGGGADLALDNLVANPEPGTGLLVAGGLVGLGLRGRARRGARATR